MSRRQPGRAQLRDFWQSRQQLAGKARFSGYLSDDSLPLIGQTRFESEWRQVDRWIKKWAVGNDSCLDLGCGSGEWALRFARHFKRVYALDWAPSMVQATRRAAAAEGVKNVVIKKGEVTNLRGHERFHVIFVGGVLMYSTDAMLHSIMKAITRLLKPGGLLILRESTVQGPTWYRSGVALRAGLLATRPSKKDYSAIYRDVALYWHAVDRTGLRRMHESLNRHYKFTDLCENWLRRINRWTGGSLQGDREGTQRWAKRIFAWSWLTLWPGWILGAYLFKTRWRLKNRWLLARKEVYFQ